MKFLTLPHFSNPLKHNPLKQMLWAICTLLGTGFFATAMVQQFDTNFNGWELLLYTLKNDALGGSPRIHFVLLMVVEMMLMVSAIALMMSMRIQITLIITCCFLLFFAFSYGTHMWFFPHTLLFFSLLSFFVATYFLPARDTFFQPILFIINTLALIYVLWMTVKLPLLTDN